MTDVLMNASFNASFNEGTYRRKGEMGVEIPVGWSVGWLDAQRTSRNAPEKALKPEFMVIPPTAPYDKPPRVLGLAGKALKIFKQWGTMEAWVYQTISTDPMKTYQCQFAAFAHAWARKDEDIQAGMPASQSTGVPGPFFEIEGRAGLSDDQKNFRFMVGIDPTGGVSPFAGTVVWGQAAHIYNAYHEIPSVKCLASSSALTVFIKFDNLWGFNNSDAYLDGAWLEIEEIAQPGSVRGLPREQYARTFYVIPQAATEERAVEIFREGFKDKRTVGFSYDDAGIGDLDQRTAVLFDIPPAEQNKFADWYAQYYPGVAVEFRPKA